MKRPPGARRGLAVARLAGALVAGLLLAGCGLIEELTEEAPPEKAASDSQANQGDGAQSEANPETEAASIPPPDDPRLLLRVPFEPGEAVISYDSEISLEALAATLIGNPAATPEIYAYWNAASAEPDQAKLFALKRGTMVRSFLKYQGATVPHIRLAAVSDPAPDLVDLLRPQR